MSVGFSLFVGAACGVPAAREAYAGGAAHSDVGLVVAVVIDQMRPDHLERYDRYFQHGLRRILDEGYRFTNATHDNALTYTAAGHANLSTGVHPARSGIVANEWREAGDGWRESVYAVFDGASPVLGRPDLEGRSPGNLLRGGLADWLVAVDSSAKVVSLSRKDRGSITMAGRARGDVYWLAEPDLTFVTSTYYRDAYPEWIQRFNAGVPDLLKASIWGDSVWESAIPAGAPLEREDAAPFEGDGTHTTFPHRYADAVGVSLGSWLIDTPFPDLVVALAAIEAISALDLGGDDVPDYLSLSFSSTDYVGHEYGPLSWEQFDNLLHLDRALGLLLDALDERVGPGRWVLGFSSDHGVLTAPEHLEASGVPALRLRSSREMREKAAEASPEGDTGPESRARMATAVETLDYVADAITIDELERRGWGRKDPYIELLRRSYHPERRFGPLVHFGLFVRFQENVLLTSDAATHGSPYLYDRAVPLVFLGGGLSPGISEEVVHTVSLAPTLARAAGIPAPDDLDGEVLRVW